MFDLPSIPGNLLEKLNELWATVKFMAPEFQWKHLLTLSWEMSELKMKFTDFQQEKYLKIS